MIDNFGMTAIKKKQFNLLRKFSQIPANTYLLLMQCQLLCKYFCAYVRLENTQQQKITK